MSWYDPCSECGEPKRDCECKHVPPPIKEKTYDLSGRFKVMEDMFLGVKCLINRNLTYEEACSICFSLDVYTSRYILPDNVSHTLTYDYDYRIPSNLKMKEA